MIKFSLPLLFASVLCAQAPDNPQQTGDAQPIFRVTVVERTTNAVSYRHRSGWTKVDLHGTPLAPEASGHADVNSRPGYIEVKTQMHHLESAAKYGPEYLTYVLWAITPEGRSKNLGEVVLDDGNSHLDVTTDLQAFALIVTAEPYFGVTQPSDVVVMENIIRPGYGRKDSSRPASSIDLSEARRVHHERGGREIPCRDDQQETSDSASGSRERGGDRTIGERGSLRQGRI